MCDIDDGDISYQYMWRSHRSDRQATNGPLEVRKFCLKVVLLTGDLLDGKKVFGCVWESHLRKQADTISSADASACRIASKERYPVIHCHSMPYAASTERVGL